MNKKRLFPLTAYTAHMYAQKQQLRCIFEYTYTTWNMWKCINDNEK